MYSLLIPKKKIPITAPHNINTTPTLEFFLGTQTQWSRNSASIHSGLPGKPHQDAKTCSFSQVLGGFPLRRWDWTEPDHWAVRDRIITGLVLGEPLGNIQNFNEVETKIAKPKMCQKCSVLFSKTAKMHVKCDRYGVLAPFQTSPCIFWETILDISTNPPSQSWMLQN